jgi:hypothetical protein
MAEVPTLRFANTDQAGSSIRWIVTTIGSSLAARGYVSDSEWELYGGLLAALLMLLWGLFANRDAGLIQSAEAVPAVQQIVVEPEAAASLPEKTMDKQKLSIGRRTGFVPALLLGLFLVGCQTTAGPGPVNPTLIQTLVSQLPESISGAIRDKCGWVEDQGVIANIVKAFILANVGTTASDVYNGVINEICGTVKNHRRRGPAVVRGVQLRGHFVSR